MADPARAGSAAAAARTDASAAAASALLGLVLIDTHVGGRPAVAGRHERERGERGLRPALRIDRVRQVDRLPAGPVLLGLLGPRRAAVRRLEDLAAHARGPPVLRVGE